MEIVPMSDKATDIVEHDEDGECVGEEDALLIDYDPYSFGAFGHGCHLRKVERSGI